MREQMNSRIWRIATLIKLVAYEDIQAICKVADRLNHNFDFESIDKLDNNIVYDCYVKECENV